MAYRNYANSNARIVSADGLGDFKTIAAALTASSSGDTIFLHPGTYTENLTLKAGVNICSFGSEASVNNTGAVQITGKATFTGAGTVSISGVQLNTNSDFLLAVTGSAVSIVSLTNCYLNCSNNTGISLTSSGVGSEIVITNCLGILGTTGIALFAVTAGHLEIDYSSFTNPGNSTTASTISNAATVQCLYAVFVGHTITSSNTSAVSLFHCTSDNSANNAACVTLNGTGSSGLYYTRLASGTATPLSIGAGETVIVDALTLSHSNATAVSGSGAITYGSIFQDVTVGAISPTTILGKGTIGINNGTAPVAGYIGELISSNIAAGSHVSVSNSTPTTITSINLTPGTWLIFGTVVLTGGTVTTYIFTSINTTTNALGTEGVNYLGIPASTAGNDASLTTPLVVATLSATTTYYMVAQYNYSAGTGFGYGKMQAIRIA